MTTPTNIEDRERLVRVETKIESLLALLAEIRSLSRDAVTRSEITKIEKHLDELRAEIKGLESDIVNINAKVVKIAAIIATLAAVATFLAKFI